MKTATILTKIKDIKLLHLRKIFKSGIFSKKQIFVLILILLHVGPAQAAWTDDVGDFFTDDIPGFFEDGWDEVSGFFSGLFGPGDGSSGSSFSDYRNFIVVSLAGLVFLFRIPSMASALAGTSLELAGAGVAIAAAAMAKNTSKGTMNRMREGYASAKEAGKAGAGAGGMAKSAVTGMMLSSGARKHRRDERKLDSIGKDRTTSQKTPNAATPSGKAGEAGKDGTTKSGSGSNPTSSQKRSDADTSSGKAGSGSNTSGTEKKSALPSRETSAGRRSPYQQQLNKK